MKIRNRWLVVLGTLLAMPCVGAIYTWSLFNNHLMANFGWQHTEVVLTYSIAIFMFAFSTMFAGKLQDKIGPRIVTIIGGILYGSGLMLASTATSLTQLYIYIGIIVGAGVGTVYICCLSTGVKWFPERKGFISGVVLGAFGLGSFIFSPLVQYFIELVGASSAFFYLGIVYLALILIGAMFLVVPDTAAAPTTNTANTPVVEVKEYTTGEMLKTRAFYMVWLTFFFACTMGHLIIGIATDIGILLAGLPVAVAGGIVSVFSLLNTAGRLTWGPLADKIGRFKVLTILFSITAVTMILMGTTPITHITFFVYLGMVGFCFGGFLASYPGITGEFYGLKHYGTNYGIMYQAFGIGALVGAFIKANTAYLETTFLVLAGLAIGGIVLSLITKNPNASVSPKAS